MTWRIHIDWAPEQYAYRVWAMGSGPGKKVMYLSDMEFTEIDNPELHPGKMPDVRPFYIKERGFLQALVDAAWREGIKPEALQADASEIGATKRHLDDMRTIVAAKMNVPLLMKVGK